MELEIGPLTPERLEELDVEACPRLGAEGAAVITTCFWHSISRRGLPAERDSIRAVRLA